MTDFSFFNYSYFGLYNIFINFVFRKQTIESYMKIKGLFNKDFTLDIDNISLIPCFAKLKKTKQSKTYHQEGSAWIHTLLVVEAMEKLLQGKETVGSENWQLMIASALCHDLGKGKTNYYDKEAKDYKCKNHGYEGSKIVRELFRDEDILLREKLCYMVRYHMTLHYVLRENQNMELKLKKLSHGIVDIEHMLMLNYCDCMGSHNDIETEEHINNKMRTIREKCLELDCLNKPYSKENKTDLIKSFLKKEGENNEKGKFNVYIMCGFPGCGKSTYIKENLSDKKVISRDIIRCELRINGANFDNNKKTVGSKEEEKRVSKICDNTMLNCCKKHEDFVIDNINLREVYRKEIISKIIKYSPTIHIIYIEAPKILASCMDRREGEIEIGVYEKMINYFDIPNLYECHELVFVKQKENGEYNTFSFE